MNDKITEVPKFKEYLTKIGITKPLCQRIDALFELAGIMYGAQLGDTTDIFVTDYIQVDNSRVYSGIDFYSKDCAISSSDLAGDIDLRIGKISKNVVFIHTKAKDYDFKKATEKSRLYVTCNYTSENSSDFKAAKENCDYLKEIIRKYVVPNLIALASP